MKAANNDYVRYLEPGFTPFDPIALARKTEGVICDGNRRKYTKFCSQRFYGGIATGYTCGCCLRCIFCWAGLGRDFPEKYGFFVSPEEAFERLKRVAVKAGYDQLRLSGAEPTLGREHLLELLELVEKSEFRTFILETNGIMFGADAEYARQIAGFEKVHTRVALKAGAPEAFTWKTGARPEFFELPFDGIANLLKAGASVHVAAVSADPRFMNDEERQALLERLRAIHPELVKNLEEEIVSPYHNALERLKHAGVKVDWEQ
ncbi:MAG: radical SAM protein [Planctomycetota bacterium]